MSRPTLRSALANLRAALALACDERDAARHERTLVVQERDEGRHQLTMLRRALVAPVAPPPHRERLPPTRTGTTRRFMLVRPPRPRCCPQCDHRWSEDGHEVRLYFTANTYADGRPGELFVHADQAGSFTSGVLDALAIMISLALQYGVPMDTIARKIIGTRFDPAGLTGDAEYRSCSSVLDLLGRWLRDRFGTPETET